MCVYTEHTCISCIDAELLLLAGSSRRLSVWLAVNHSHSSQSLGLSICQSVCPTILPRLNACHRFLETPGCAYTYTSQQNPAVSSPGTKRLGMHIIYQYPPVPRELA